MGPEPSRGQILGKTRGIEAMDLELAFIVRPKKWLEKSSNGVGAQVRRDVADAQARLEDRIEINRRCQGLCVCFVPIAPLAMFVENLFLAEKGGVIQHEKAIALQFH